MFMTLVNRHVGKDEDPFATDESVLALAVEGITTTP
jgi:hypothetical protein